MKRVTLLALVAFLLPSTFAWAQTDPLAGWITDPRYSVVRALADDHRIELVPADDDVAWSDDDLAAIRAGAAAVPAAMIERLAQPIRMRRVHQECLFGVGRFTEHCPTYDDDGNFLIYDMPPVQGEGPVERLRPLDAGERADIQRRRAAVHAIVLAWDIEHDWSDSKAWRQISGWRTARQPFNRDLYGYSRYLGYRSPRLDLVTFVEEWIIRPEDVIADERRQTIDPNMSVECQEFTKGQLVAKWLTSVDPRWSPAARSAGPVSARCPAFEQWANTANLESIDVLVAAASARRPESLYGHLLLHVRYTDRAEGFEPVYQFGAVTGTHVAPLTYLSRGLLGGFLSVIELNSFRGADRVFLQHEQRNLKRYELRLSAAQRRRVLQRIWEFERHVRYPYHFFANNCASFVYDLLVPALQLEDIPNRSRLIVAPTDVLDYLAKVDNPGYGTLLRKRPEVEFSSREIAQDAVDARRKTLQRLQDALHTPQLRALDRALDSSKPADRESAYRTLQTKLMSALRDADPQTVRLAIDYLHRCGQVERYFAEEAFFRTRAVKSAAAERPIRLSAEELLTRRRELYRSEDAEARYQQLMEWTDLNERRLADGPFRDFTEREAKILETAAQSEAAYLAALDAQAAVIEEHDPAFDGVAYLAAHEAEFRTEQSRRDRLATGPSGKGRIAVGGSGTTSDGTSFGGAFDGSYAFIFERLGEQRRRGFRSDIESRALGLRLHVPINELFYEQVDIDLTVLRFMTIEQKMGPIRRNFLGNFGWGAEVYGGHDGRRDLNFDGGLTGGVLLPLFQTDAAANHLVIGAFADARLQFGALGRRILAGGDGFMRLLVHLGGVYANSLRLQGHSRHWFAFETLSYEWEYTARLGTEHAIAFIGDHPLVLSPWALLEWTSVDYTPRAEHRDVRAGLSFELPL